MTSHQIITLAIFLITYICLAFGSIPKLNISRAEIAFIGAVALLVFTSMTLTRASHYIDYSVICLLFAMMVLAAYLDISGFIKCAMHWLNKKCQKPITLLAVTILLSGVLSAFLINDVICIIMTPLVLHICQKRQLPAIPYLLSVCTAANIGSVATITGNPQNMLIASYAHVSYLHFMVKTAPIAMIGLLINFALIAWLYRRELYQKVQQPVTVSDSFVIENRFLFFKSLIVTVTVIGLFLTSLPLSVIALAGAAVMLFGSTPPKDIYNLVDWPLLLLFVSLFVIVGHLEYSVLDHWDLDKLSQIQHMPKQSIAIAALVLSNTVSNVPAALLFKPVILHLPHTQHFAIFLAVMSTLAGNLTVLGSIANLIVVGQAKRAGINISFWTFLKLGIPLALLTSSMAYIIL